MMYRRGYRYTYPLMNSASSLPCTRALHGLDHDVLIVDSVQLAAVAALCIQYEADFRPSMTIVVKALQTHVNARPGGDNQ
jgi:hypothetical protein